MSRRSRASGAAPAAPFDRQPKTPPEHLQLWADVRDALYNLRSYFRSELIVSGVLATDLFTFNSSLAATIEQQVVNQLNQLREVWDREKRYALYRFERQPQRFPDVVLKTSAPGLSPIPLLGIELKGWYVLAREREPSFRYTATPAVCSAFDLLAVFPWALSGVVSGSPILFGPFVAGARFLAEYRNYHWQHLMSARSSKAITLSKATSHYPKKGDEIEDRPVADQGRNFGRLARTGLMDAYMTDLFQERLSGIPLDDWQEFFRGHG